jgi:hypothetical protein
MVNQVYQGQNKMKCGLHANNQKGVAEKPGLSGLHLFRGNYP